MDHTLTAATGHRGGTLKCRLRGILFFFGHRITNVASKSLNSRIQAIRVAARGFRSREHFKTAICLHCPGLDVYPVTHSIAGRARVIGVAEGRWSTPYTLRIRADSDGLLEMFRHSSLATSGSPSRRACQRCHRAPRPWLRLGQDPRRARSPRHGVVHCQAGQAGAAGPMATQSPPAMAPSVFTPSWLVS